MDCQITVLMAVHNGTLYLRTAIVSILQQTYRNFRFLIVDDASTDDTRDIVRSYNDKRIELLCLDRNVGQTATLNIGLRHASTPWIARMDADDYSAPTRLEQQMQALEADPSLTCLGTFAWEFRDDPSVVEAIQTKPLQHTDIMRALLRGSPIIHGSLVVRRMALLDVGGYNERYRYSADLELYDRLLSRYFSANIAKPLLGLRRHDRQGSYSRTAIEEGIQIFSRRLSSNGYCPDDVAIIRASLSVSYLQRVRLLRAERMYLELMKDLFRAFQASPGTFLWYCLEAPIVYLMPKQIRAALKRLWISLSSRKISIS